MTKRLRLSVRSTRTRTFGWAWVAGADNETGNTEKIRYGYAPTMPAALAEGYAALGRIHLELMDEVHAGQARRRTLAGLSVTDELVTLKEATA